MSPRAKLIAAGVLAGAVLSVSPPARQVLAGWECAREGGRWLGSEHACEIASPTHGSDSADHIPTLLFKEAR